MRNFEETQLTPGRLVETVGGWKNGGLRVAMAIGCFDLLYVGCIRFLQDAASRGDRLAVAVYDDESVRTIRGDGRPVLSLEHRLTMVAAIEGVDAVTPVTLDGARGLIELADPHIVLAGEERTALCAGLPDQDCAKVEIVPVGMPWETCSDWLIHRIKQQL